MSMSAAAVLIAGLAGAASAHAGFVPALGSPFPYAAPTDALAVADGDRNGTVDVVAGGLTLRRGTGSGFLGNPLTVGATGSVEGVAAGDLDGDQLLDYAAIAPGASPGDARRLLRFQATPGNGFVQHTVLLDAGEATDVAVANVNGDGLPDIVFVRDEADPNVTVVLGGLPGSEELDSGIAAPRDVELGDLTGDGLPEIVVAGEQASVSVLVNEGDGFAAEDLEPTGASGATTRIALTHFDGDGRLDAVANDSGAAAVLSLRGDGGGGFQPLGPRPTGLPGAAASVGAGDLDGDGAGDVVAGGDGGFAALRGDGGGGLLPMPGSPFASGAVAGDRISELAAVDMNRDGQLDVVTANRGGSVSVLLNDHTGLMSAAPSGVDFGTLLPASGTLTRTVVLRSTRGRLRVTRLDRQGSRTFNVRDINCVGTTLALGQACSVSVTFAVPRKARRYEALLSVDANAAAVVVPLSATPRPPIVARPRLKRKRVKAGVRLDLRYRLSEGALTRVLTERALPGRRARDGECVEPKRGNLERRRCTIWERVAVLSRRDLAGVRRMRVVTRGEPTGVGRKRRRGEPYAAGRYRLSISAADRFRNRSIERRLPLRLIRPAPRASK
jgi:hypothetical protein